MKLEGKGEHGAGEKEIMSELMAVYRLSRRPARGYGTVRRR